MALLGGLLCQLAFHPAGGVELPFRSSHSRPSFTSSRDFDSETAIWDRHRRPSGNRGIRKGLW